MAVGERKQLSLQGVGRIPMAGFAGYQGWMLLLLDTVFPPAMDEYTVNGLVLLNYTVLIITTLC